ncbi:asparagine synthase C-terminal domain-containing protein [Sphingomonas panacis]|uniref:asparagine synthase-related protein n=1 Tax=Sphingomonas panacis TaxID=1560345 RepID=UPI0009F47875|nr:asparagine synthase C-terminal domain-containing protein [Sphingomonas panacis]
MLYEYLIIVAKGSNIREDMLHRLADLTGLAAKFSSETLAVLASVELTVTPLGETGAIVGTIFHRHGPPEALAAFTIDEVRAIQRSDGSHLLSRYWGGYVAVFETEHGSRIIRDPSASITCYQVEVDGLFAFASSAETLHKATLYSPTANWQNLARHIYTDGLPAVETGLTGVKEVLPGTSVVLENGQDQSLPCWSPWDHVEVETSSTERLRRAVLQAVSAWGSCYPRVLIGVSGGLDSSIVASCLSSKGHELTCMTMTTNDADGDERRYARILCDTLNVELIEDHYSLDDIELGRSAARHLPLPVSRTQSLAYNAAVARQALRSSADVFFSGNGGDNVFAYSQSATSLYDRYLHEGWSLDLLRTVGDICKLTGCSPIQAVKSARRISKSKSRSYRWRPQPLFLAQEVLAIETSIPISHPWLEAPKNALPGKAAHIAGLLRVQPNLQTSEAAIGLPVVNPLMAQPVMEACLHIPTWRWCAGGVNRAVAREAFAGVLPSDIAYRTTKGRPDGFCNEIIDTRRGHIRERLLDGHLVRNKILDAKSIDQTLAEESPNRGIEQIRLLSLIEMEAWLDHWVGP